MGQTLRTIFLVALAIGLFLKAGEAVAPSSISLEIEERQSERQKLIGVVEKLERHEEENIHFLRELKHDLQGLKT